MWAEGVCMNKILVWAEGIFPQFTCKLQMRKMRSKIEEFDRQTIKVDILSHGTH